MFNNRKQTGARFLTIGGMIIATISPLFVSLSVLAQTAELEKVIVVQETLNNSNETSQGCTDAEIEQYIEQRQKQ